MEKREILWKFIEQPKRTVSYIWNYKILNRDNAFLIQKEANKYRNQLMIESPFSIIKLLGWTDQYDEDYYWIIQEKRKNKKTSIILSSCVGGFIPLKNKISDYEYLQLEHIWNMNMSEYNIEKELKNRKIILK